MGSDDPPKPPPTPLWQYMRSMAHVPPPPRPTGIDELPPRPVTEADLWPLRRELEWRPTRILDDFGPARTEREYLGKLLVACAVIQGPHRLAEMTDRLRSMQANFLPRLRHMRDDEALAPRAGELDELVKRLNSGLKEMVQTRARAANDMEGEPANPDGLRLVDLFIIANQVNNAVAAQEVVQRRNIAGIDFGLGVGLRAPDMRYAEDWLDRTMGNAQLNGILLFWPPAWGRVVVVYEDGRLAYDPGADPEEP